jgi:hypothetical protein
LGGSGAGRSRLLDMFEKKSSSVNKRKRLQSDEEKPDGKVIVIDDSFEIPRKSFHDRIKIELAGDEDDDIIFIDDEFDETLMPFEGTFKSPEETPQTSDVCNCPCCNAMIDVNVINENLDQCLGFS